MPYEVFQGTNSAGIPVPNDYRFRVKGDNGEIIASSEAYTRDHDAHRGYEGLKRVVTHDAREALLDMFADSRRFDADPDDGDCDYHITICERNLKMLLDAVGIVGNHDESAQDTILRLIAESATMTPTPTDSE